MKYLRATGQERVYAVRPSELQMLLVVLGSFPLARAVPSLSKSGDPDRLAEAQKLLEEAMKERRESMQEELEKWLRAPDRFRQAGEHLEWRIEEDRREWLLQILNDVRVGAWTELGAPADLEALHREAGEESIRHIALMDMAGMFQTALLLDREIQ